MAQPLTLDPEAATALRIRSAVVIPLRGGASPSFVTFDGFADGAEHFALLFGAPKSQPAPLVRMHSECITGDVFGSLRCDCGAQLNQAICRLQAEGGALLYLRQEGRGIGLTAKLDAYKLVERVTAGTFLTDHNRGYLLAKARLTGHSLAL